MKSTLTKIFVTLGIIFLFLVLVGVSFYVTDPMNLKPAIFGEDAAKNTPTDTNSSGFQLSEPQKQALISAGIDPARVPSTISASQEACFATALGAARVEEIKGGAVPGGVEFLKAKSCL